MAAPPFPAPAAGATPPPLPPPGLGAAPPPGEELVEEPVEDAEEVVATICKRPDGTYILYTGDEPEEEMEMAETAAPGAMDAAPEGQEFDSPQSLMRGIMELLETGTGAEEAFAGGFNGDRAPPAEMGGPKPPPMGM